MPMHNPPHPGEFIREVYLEPNDITGRQLAAVPESTPKSMAFHSVRPMLACGWITPVPTA